MCVRCTGGDVRYYGNGFWNITGKYISDTSIKSNSAMQTASYAINLAVNNGGPGSDYKSVRRQ